MTPALSCLLALTVAPAPGDAADEDPVPAKGEAPARRAPPPPPPPPAEAQRPVSAEAGAPPSAPPARRAGGPPAPPPRAALERQASVRFPTAKKRGLYKPPGSPQRFELEVKLGPYVPEVDRRYDGPGLGPYATIYGTTDENGLATGAPKPGPVGFVSFEWQFFYVYGALGLGLQAGFFRDTAKAPLADPPPDGPARSEADDTSFNVLPLSLTLGYRFSYLDDRFHVPIVPYLRTGLGYGFWWSTDGRGKVAENDAGKASGGSWGWQVSAGGMLRLDWVSFRATRSMDAETGVNHFALFGEYQVLRLDDFGSGKALSVGDATWLLGLAVEF